MAYSMGMPIGIAVGIALASKTPNTPAVDASTDYFGAGIMLWCIFVFLIGIVVEMINDWRIRK